MRIIAIFSFMNSYTVLIDICAHQIYFDCFISFTLQITSGNYYDCHKIRYNTTQRYYNQGSKGHVFSLLTD